MMMMYYTQVDLRFYGLDADAGKALDSRCTNKQSCSGCQIYAKDLHSTGDANSVSASCGCRVAFQFSE